MHVHIEMPKHILLLILGYNLPVFAHFAYAHKHLQLETSTEVCLVLKNNIGGSHRALHDMDLINRA